MHDTGFARARRLLRTAAVTAAAAIVPFAAAHSGAMGPPAPIVWAGADGLFFDPEAWIPNVVPGPGDTARFDTLGPGRVTIDERVGGVMVGELIFGGGATSLVGRVMVDHPTPVVVQADPVTGAAGRILVGGPGSPIVELLIARDSGGDLELPGLEADELVVGTADGPGTLISIWVVAARCLVHGPTRVGDAAAGILQFRGGLLTDSLEVGVDATGVVESSDLLTVAGTTTIGVRGSGALRHLTGGPATFGDLSLGGVLGASGFVDLRGGSSTDPHRVIGDLTVGTRGLATFQLLVPLVVEDDVFIGRFTTTFENGTESFSIGSQGTLQLRTAGRLDIGGDLVVGLLGGATLGLDPAARVTVGGHLDSLPIAPGWEPRQITLRIDGTGTVEDDAMITVAGNAFPPPINVQLAGDATLAAGTRWTLLEAGGLIELSGLSVPVPPAGLAWQLTDAAGRVAIELVAAPVAADLNGDGLVDVVDLVTLLAAWGACPGGTPCPADLDADGLVGVQDLLVLLTAWS